MCSNGHGRGTQEKQNIVGRCFREFIIPKFKLYGGDLPLFVFEPQAGPTLNVKAGVESGTSRILRELTIKGCRARLLSCDRKPEYCKNIKSLMSCWDEYWKELIKKDRMGEGDIKVYVKLLDRLKSSSLFISWLHVYRVLSIELLDNGRLWYKPIHGVIYIDSDGPGKALPLLKKLRSALCFADIWVMIYASQTSVNRVKSRFCGTNFNYKDTPTTMQQYEDAIPGVWHRFRNESDPAWNWSMLLREPENINKTAVTIKTIEEDFELETVWQVSSLLQKECQEYRGGKNILRDFVLQRFHNNTNFEREVNAAA